MLDFFGYTEDSGSFSKYPVTGRLIRWVEAVPIAKEDPWHSIVRMHRCVDVCYYSIYKSVYK